jgi:opacity protein-like surface antigen
VRSGRAVALTATAHVAGMLLGSAATASLLAISARLAGPLPAAAVAAVCLLAAAALLAESRLRPPGSHWMVPHSWARFGHSGFAALFGVALGAGFVTVLPSAGWYGVVAAAQAGTPWWAAFAILLSFGAARALLVPFLTAWSARHGAHPVARIDALAATARRLRPVELALLVALGAGALAR